ncbi:MAG: hypothetical protein ACLGGX_12730 [Bdellovibrionia bacterium]
MKWISLLQLLSAFVFMIFSPQAVVASNATEYVEFYVGSRCLAMGGACVAVVNDETALAINPAALGRVRGFYGTFFDPEIEFNYLLNDFSQKGSLGDLTTLNDLKSSLDSMRGLNYYARTSFFPSFVGRNFGVGILYNTRLGARMSNDGTTIDANYRSDMGLLLGYNLSFFGGVVKLGFNGKLINRIEVKNEALSAASSLAYKDIGSEGTGLSVDAGLMLVAPVATLPTLAIVARDLGGTAFDKMDGVRLKTASQPEAVKQDVDVGLSLSPIHNNKFRSTWTIEYKGALTAADEDDSAKRIHGGFEVNFGDVFFMRAGYNQRYFTGGLELASEFFQWQITTYGEEIGDSVNGKKEDRRYAVKFAWRF